MNSITEVVLWRDRPHVIIASGIVIITNILGFVLVTACGLQWQSKPHDFQFGTRVAWQPEQQHLLTSPMSARPTPGWRLTTTDLGLPEGSQVATDDMPIHSFPLVGNIDDRSFFLVRTPDTVTQWWFTGVDVAHGQRLFPAIPLNAGQQPECFLNGPDDALCLTAELTNRTAWVIDSRDGTVTFTGPTDLDVRPNDLNVAQIGIYAVAESVDEGIYGIGPTADTTWFVPGAGDATPQYLGTGSGDLPPIAFQTTLGRGSDGNVVFSLTDGRVIKPRLPPRAEQQQTALYRRGFATDVQLDGPGHAIQFYDETGKRTSPRAFPGGLTSPTDFFELPILTNPDENHAWAALTPSGGLVFAAPKDAGRPVRIVGSRIIIAASDFAHRGWAQYDLASGTWGKRCTNLDMDGGYLGFDGHVVVTSDGNQTVGLDTEATDLDTCERLWVITSTPRTYRDVWRINTMLVQLSEDGTELMSLVAPS